MKTQIRFLSLFMAAAIAATPSLFALPQQTGSTNIVKATSPTIEEFDPKLVESEFIDGVANGMAPGDLSTPAISTEKQITAADNQDKFRMNGQPQLIFSGTETETTGSPKPAKFQSEFTDSAGTQSFLTEMPVNDGNMIETRIAPAIQTQVMAPKYININQVAPIYLQAQNIGRTDVKSVRLIAQLPDHARFESSNPSPSNVSGQTYEFTLNNLSSQSKKIVRINVVPTAKLPLNIATQVRTESQQQIAVSVQQPVLDIEINGPRAIQTGQKVEHSITVKNTGDGPAEEIRIKPILPENLQLAPNQKTLVPKLVPGQSTTFVLTSFARSAGDSNLVFQVSATGITTRETRSNLRIIRPELSVQILGPSQTFLGRNGIYTIQLENAGDLPINNVDVTLRIPDGLKINTISQQADVDKISGVLKWQFPKIDGNQQQLIQFKADAIQIGDQVFGVTVTSQGIGSKSMALTTTVQGRADLSLRLFDRGEPIGVGSKTDFTVEVRNDGSTEASDVKVLVHLPEELMPVSQEHYSIDPTGRYIQFRTLNIGPGKTEIMKFRVVAVGEGEHVVRGSVSIEGMAQSIISENSIYVYESKNAKVSEALTPEIRR